MASVTLIKEKDRDLRGNSWRWANWMSQLTPTSCKYCIDKHGTICDISILEKNNEIPVHERCKCEYVPMRTKLLGSITSSGIEGMDVFLAYWGILPGNYIGKDSARNAGWKPKKSLSNKLPGKSIGGDIYANRNLKLPQIPGRVWYEADINYTEGKRNSERLLYSNDGLMFVTYDHYETFYEIIGI